MAISMLILSHNDLDFDLPTRTSKDISFFYLSHSILSICWNILQIKLGNVHKKLKCFTVQRKKFGREVPLRNSLHLISSAFYTFKKAVQLSQGSLDLQEFSGEVRTGYNW